MEASEIAEFARKFAVMVRIHGPDPKSLKSRRHAFHLHRSGKTTLSASGLLLHPDSLTQPLPILDHICSIHNHSGSVVITPASVVEPFLVAEQRNTHHQEFRPKLIPDARVDVLAEVKSESCGDGPDEEPHWLQSQLLALVDVSASSLALISLIGDHVSWDVGWSLPPLQNASQSMTGVLQKQGNDASSVHDSALMAKLATRIAFLGVQSDTEDIARIDASQPQQKGDHILVMGSPFGILSPLHFFNSISVGTVANSYPPGSYNTSLLMADIRCFPGMEGGPVFNRKGHLCGILSSPIRPKGSNAEIQLVVTWEAIVTAWSKDVEKDAQELQGQFVGSKGSSLLGESPHKNSGGRKSINCLSRSSVFYRLSKSPLRKAILSVVLVTVGGGVWASGIVLNCHGLILTNAHILEPLEFGRSRFDPRQRTTSVSSDHSPRFHQRKGVSEQIETSNNTMHVSNEPSSLYLSYTDIRKISIRMDHVEPSIWSDARVIYISKGPLDVALLQLESVSNKLFPITPQFLRPSKGLTVHAIGHGLVGPRSDLQPSVSSGVLANNVSMPRPLQPHEFGVLDKENRYLPIMLQTTAAIHPGASGGAMVDSDGCMIGLITSNVRHGGGTIIPHMNFSIPTPALKPIFEFSENHDLSILTILDEPNEFLSSIWALAPPSPPDFEIPSETKKFSKYFSEEHTEAISVDQGPITREKLPSKI